MSKKHGNVKNGILQKRGNNTGTLFRKKDKSGKEYGYYFMRFSERSPEGKRIRTVFSTQTEDLSEAREALNAKATELGFGKSDASHISALIKAKTNIDNEQAVKDQKAKEAAEKQKQDEEAEAAQKAAAETALKTIDVKSAFAYYKASPRRPDSGDVTLRGYEQQYQKFADWMAKKHPEQVLLRDVTQETAGEFLKHIENTRSRNTRNKYLIFLRSLWRVVRWEKDAHLDIDPWEGIRSLTKTPDEVPHRELTTEELGRIAHVLIGNEPIPGNRIHDAAYYKGVNVRNELRILFAIGLYTGLRLGDCATLKWSDVDLIKGIISTIPLKTKRKYNRRVIIPIHRALAAILTELHDESGTGKQVLPVAAAMYNGERSNLTNRTQAIFKAAKIDTSVEAPEGGEKARTLVGFHSLRHTFTSLLINAGAKFSFVEKMLGHSSESMTPHYFHENASALAGSVALLPIVPELLPPTADASCIDVWCSAKAVTSSALPSLAGAESELADLLKNGDKDGALALLQKKLAGIQ